MLSEIHEWAKQKNFSFAFLFGRHEIYQSSGYIQCKNEIKIIDHLSNTTEIKRIESTHYYPLKNESWPESLIDIQGPKF